MTYMNDLVEVVGIADCFPELDCEHDFWTQICIQEVACIPEKKPDVEQICKIGAGVDIISQRVVKTPVSLGPNLSGKMLTGKKLIIEGRLKHKVCYIADLPQQPIHAAHYCLYFSAFIIVPGSTSVHTKFKIIPYIEDILINMRTKKKFFRNTTVCLRAIVNHCW